MRGNPAPPLSPDLPAVPSFSGEPPEILYLDEHIMAVNPVNLTEDIPIDPDKIEALMCAGK